MIKCPKEMLPEDTKEGIILTIAVDDSATAEKLLENTARMNRLFKD